VNALVVLFASLPSMAVVRHVRGRLGADPAADSLWWTFVLGGLTTALILAAAPLLAPAFVTTSGAYAAGFSQAMVSAAIPEEVVKFIVIGLAVARGAVRDRRTGLAHGLAASMGFAAVEMVVFAGFKGMGAVVVRTLTTLPCHAFLGCLMGSLVGDAVLARRFQAVRAAAALVVAVTLHGAYDFPLMVLGRPDAPPPGTWAFALLTASATTTLILGTLLAARLYGKAFAPRLRNVAARPTPARGRMRAHHAGIVAWSLIPLGVLLASVGGWIVGGLLSVDISAASAPNVERAATLLWAVGASLLGVGFAFGIHGLRARHTARRVAARI
jgi:hypothetical protein